jgi:hypothetical protein
MHLEVRVRPLVHPPDEHEDRRREPEAEERGAVPAGKVRAAATAQPDRTLREEEERNRG